MRFVCFNANGIRARLHQLDSINQSHNPDVIAIQETKVQDAEFPEEAVDEIGFPHMHYYGQKGHYGVALLSKRPLTNVQLGFPWREEDQQRRFIRGTYEDDGAPIHIINGYFPQGESRDHPTKFPAKAQFYEDLQRYLDESFKNTDRVLVTGDMNIAPTDEDIGIGDDNKKRWLSSGKSSFLPEEREWIDKLLGWGLHDTYALSEPKERLFSWFDYRSKGFDRDPKRGLRIDLILASKALLPKVVECGIDYDIRGEAKPSDHCPIWSYIE